MARPEESGARDETRVPDPRPAPNPNEIHVAVVRWPDDREEVRELIELDRPCLLLVGPDTPPPVLTACLVDWVRTPVTDGDVRSRVLALAERAATHPSHPSLDENGRLSYRGSHVFLSPLDEYVARALVDSFGHGVAETQLRHPDWATDMDGGERTRLAVTRLRRRIRPLGLGITAMRNFGYYLHDADSPR